MNARHPVQLGAAAIALGLSIAPRAYAASYVYEGQLADRGVPASGRYDLQVTPSNDTPGTRAPAPITIPDVAVRGGHFRIEFDLPQSEARIAFVELGVRDAGTGGTFEPVPGRAKVAATIGACWSSTGDAGSNPATNFLGTTDGQPLVLRVMNQQVARFEPSALLFAGAPLTANVGAGAASNTILPGVRGATIGGGGMIAGSSDPSFSSGGPNRVTDSYATIGGGYGNVAGDNAGTTDDSGGSTVSGGAQNVASGAFSAVGGGRLNLTPGDYSTIAGGSANTVMGLEGAIGGGNTNAVLGSHGTVGGGQLNCAGGSDSWAGGSNAVVRPAANPGNAVPACTGLASYPGGIGDQGTFVWSDTQNSRFVSTGPNQFMVRADGGVAINTAPIDPKVELTIASNSGTDYANIWLKQSAASDTGVLLIGGDGSATAGSNDSAFYIDHFNGTAQARRLALKTDGSVFIRSNITGANTGVTMAANGGSWSSLSDRRVKTDLVPVDAESVLERVVATPVNTWSYIAQGTGIRHMGPMAQDFFAAFGLGEDDTHITTIDAEGVAMAAIQGLHARLERENAQLRAQNDAVQQSLAELRRDNALLRNDLDALARRAACDAGK